MSNYQYKTVAAPGRVKKMRGVRGRDAQLALMIEELIQEQALAGWEYMRSDIFPVSEGGGWFSKERSANRAILIFRRATASGVSAPPPHAAVAAPAAAPAAAAPAAPRPPRPGPSATPPPQPDPSAAPPPRPQPAEPIPNQPSFSIAGVEPPKAPPIGGARDD